MKSALKKSKTPKRVIGFQVVEDECIWMKAGVVNLRVCDNAYDCNTCPFDKGIRRAMGLGRSSPATTCRCDSTRQTIPWQRSTPRMPAPADNPRLRSHYPKTPR